MTKAKIARISKAALEDERLSYQTLSLLLYVMNSDKIDTENFYVEQVTSRFGKKRGWWNKHFNALIKYGYARRKKGPHDKEGHPTQLYAVSDYLEAMKDDRVTKDLFANTELGLKRIYKPTSSNDPGSRNTAREDGYVHSPQNYILEKPGPEKFLEVGRQDNEHLEILRFFMGYGFAAPKTPKEWEEAKKPGIRAWAEITETPLDWQAARLLNKRLIEPINRNALEVAWERWTSTSYRKQRAIGVIEWYEELCEDITATPWNKGQQYGRKKDGPKKSVRRSNKQHGTASAAYNADDFTKV
ncbi:MAG: hypothetical protein ACXQTR_00885 [Candidatus Methanospirareceae archaeon]